MTTEDKLDRLNEMCRSTPDCADCNIYRAGLYYLCVAFTFETMGDKNVNLLYSTAFLKDVPTGSAPDNVNHPAHYQGAHECIEVMQAMFGIEAVKAFCRCNAFKYRFRADRKNGEEDIKKAEWYEDYLMKLCDSERKEHT